MRRSGYWCDCCDKEMTTHGLEVVAVIKKRLTWGRWERKREAGHICNVCWNKLAEKMRGSE